MRRSTPQAITKRHFPARIPGKLLGRKYGAHCAVGKNSTIEWCHHTFNPWIGWQKVSEGSDLCYAERMNKFYKWNGGEWGPHAPRKRTSEGYWLQPLRWAKQAGDQRPRLLRLARRLARQTGAAGVARRIGRNDRRDARARLAPADQAHREFRSARTVAAAAGAQERLDRRTTCENQEYFNRRWRYLSAIPARIRFISYEPALGPLQLGEAHPDWIICDGEDGAGARVMDPLWASDLRNECA
jgi:protein gp37